MESTTNSNIYSNYEQLTRIIVNLTNDVNNQINLDIILQVIDKIEELTGCKLFNKDYLTNELVELSHDNLLNEAKKIIMKNLIPQVDFNTLFKSNLDFIIIFKDDDINILYKNKCINDNNLSEIKSDLLKNKLNNLPPITELYVNNILDVITKFINKDVSVKYYCTNIPAPYWKLFEIKCKKLILNDNATNISDKCNELEKIISGKYYKPDKIQVINQTQDDEELKAVLMQIEEYENKDKKINTVILSDQDKKILDDIYRMEVMSYLDDNDIMLFLNTLEIIDTFDKAPLYQDIPYINKYIKTLIEATSNISNKIAKFYYVYKLYNFINIVPEFISNHDNLRNSVVSKINEFNDELYIIQTAGIKLYDELLSVINKTKEMITNIEKIKNPNYVPIWKDNNQHNILNDIVNINNNIVNNTNNNNNNYNQIELVDSDEDDDEDSEYDDDDN